MPVKRFARAQSQTGLPFAVPVPPAQCSRMINPKPDPALPWAIPLQAVELIVTRSGSSP